MDFLEALREDQEWRRAAYQGRVEGLRVEWVGRRVWVNFAYQQGYARVGGISDLGEVVLLFEQSSLVQFPQLGVQADVLGVFVIAVSFQG